MREWRIFHEEEYWTRDQEEMGRQENVPWRDVTVTVTTMWLSEQKVGWQELRILKVVTTF